MLSIVIPGIRPDRWEALLDSIGYECEVIFIGPYSAEMVPSISQMKHVKVVQDFASPNICQHKGMLHTTGDILHVFSDDCLFEEGAVRHCVESMGDFDAVVANYHEGGNKAVTDFSLNACYGRTSVPDSFVIFNTAFMRREKYFALGGFDCRFQTLCVAQADLAARWQFSAYNVKVEDIRLSACGHMPGTSGDHAPMHWSQILHDEPYYKEKYKNGYGDLVVNYDHWKNYPSVWSRFQ